MVLHTMQGPPKHLWSSPAHQTAISNSMAVIASQVLDMVIFECISPAMYHAVLDAGVDHETECVE